MNIIDIIVKKKNAQELTEEEIKYVIENYVKGNIQDYQMSSLLMAICIQGMTEKEIFHLTDAMLYSGERLSLEHIDGIKVDKHSTGGIGDKTTLVLAPLVASLGVPVAKMSGRGLGITGGTIDKLESIEGFETNIEERTFIDQVKKIGVALASQTGNLVPADKKIYALRDVTGTVDSMPLIASSIMSKKLASGADKFVLDVKVGSGALMKTLEDARMLAHLMIEIGSFYGKEVVCLLTRMGEPLGRNIGNGLEVMEAIAMLQNKGPEDLKTLVVELGSYMVSMGKQIEEDEARKLVQNALQNGTAYQKMKELIKAQKGNIEKISISSNTKKIHSIKEGYVHEIETDLLGELVHNLGAGRNRKEDAIDYGVGVILQKKAGDPVSIGEELLTVYYSHPFEEKPFIDCFKIEENKPLVEPLIYEIVRSK